MTYPNQRLVKATYYRPEAFINAGWYVIVLAYRGGHGRLVSEMGPYPTIQHAEDKADALAYEWSGHYMIAPHHGSRFARREAVA